MSSPTPIEIRPVRPDDRAEWLRMRRALWPDPTDELERELEQYTTGRTATGQATAVFVAQRPDGRLGGFVEVNLRPYAEGCQTTPVGYLEGWYVDPDLRRTGVGRALVEGGEEWARHQGCQEMASDCHADNRTSYLAHLAIGYATTGRWILFRKPLGVTPDPATEPAPRDLIALVEGFPWTEAALSFVSDPAAGGIDVFLGTTRGERNADGRDLVALDYEAYPEMALSQMRDLAARARQRWPVAKLAVVHRVGRVPVGEASVLIAVSCPHRAEAFDACRWLIDTLKAEVPIWKKEIWSDGSGRWVEGVKR